VATHRRSRRTSRCRRSPTRPSSAAPIRPARPGRADHLGSRRSPPVAAAHLGGSDASPSRRSELAHRTLDVDVVEHATSMRHRQGCCRRSWMQRLSGPLARVLVSVAISSAGAPHEEELGHLDRSVAAGRSIERVDVDMTVIDLDHNALLTRRAMGPYAVNRRHHALRRSRPPVEGEVASADAAHSVIRLHDRDRSRSGSDASRSQP